MRQLARLPAAGKRHFDPHILLQSQKKKVAARISKITKNTINEVEQLLRVGLEKEQYGRLNFGAPDIHKYFIMPLTVQDMKEGRREGDSIFRLQRLMKTLLAPTNWRLMTDGINNQRTRSQVNRCCFPNSTC